MVEAEHHPCAEERVVRVSVGSVVIVLLIPKALAGDAHSLARYLTDHDLNDDFVSGNGEGLDLLLDLTNDCFSLASGLGLIVHLALDGFMNDIFNDHLDSVWLESER